MMQQMMGMNSGARMGAGWSPTYSGGIHTKLSSPYLALSESTRPAGHMLAEELWSLDRRAIPIATLPELPGAGGFVDPGQKGAVSGSGVGLPVHA